MLVHDRDPELLASAGVSLSTRAPPKTIVPASGVVVPDATFIKRRLAGAVLAEQGVHLAGEHVEGDVASAPRSPS